MAKKHLKPEEKKEKRSIMNFFGGKITFKEPEEILQREVKKFGGGSAHVLVPKKHIGKKVQITIWIKEEEENQKLNSKNITNTKNGE